MLSELQGLLVEVKSISGTCKHLMILYIFLLL